MCIFRLHILNSGDLPAGQTLCSSSQKLSPTSEGHKKWSPNLPLPLLPEESLPGKSALLNDKTVRSFDLCVKNNLLFRIMDPLKGKSPTDISLLMRKRKTIMHYILMIYIIFKPNATE